MLDMSRTRIARAHEVSVISTDQILEVGLCVQSVLDPVSGTGQARRSNSLNNSIFLGVSWAEYNGYPSGVTVPTSYLATVGVADSSVAKGGATGYAAVTLANPSTGTPDMLVIPGNNYGAAAALAPVAIGSLAAGKYALSLDNLSIFVPNALAGTQVFITQRYAPSAQYLTLTYGDMYLPTGAQLLNRIGVITQGIVFTSNYDTAIDWSTVNDFSTANMLRGGNNGRFTVNANGCICNNTFVVSVPTATSPWLGLRIGQI